jgi:hypothetical protein
VFQIFSLFNSLFFHMFQIFSLFSSICSISFHNFFCIFHIISLFILLFFRIFHIFSLFNLERKFKCLTCYDFFNDGLIHIVIFSLLILTAICILQYSDEWFVCIAVTGRRFNLFFITSRIEYPLHRHAYE